MTGALNPSLGDLAKLPLELRYLIYECLDETFCCQVWEPLSQFHSYRHDPCIPLGISSVSKVIWGEVQQLFYQRSSRELRVQIDYDGWKTTCHPLAFRADWTAPSLSSFQRLVLEIYAPPEDDPGQALLTIRNISNFISVLNAAPSLPNTIIAFIDPSENTWRSWEPRHFHCFSYLPHYFGGPFHTRGYRVSNALYHLTACALLPLQTPPSSTVTLPSYIGQLNGTNPLFTHWPVFQNPYFIHPTSGDVSNSHSPTPTRLHLLTMINALMLSKTLDDLTGPTAAKLRGDRRRNWPAYAAWLADIRAQLQRCRPGVAFLSTDLEPGYSWKDEVAMMDDRARRRCEETRDEDWWAEKRWLKEDEGPRGATVTGACECKVCAGKLGTVENEYTIFEIAAEKLLIGWERNWRKEHGE